jgi:thioredoxin reductase (NADPH)
MLTTEVENYPGYPSILGPQLIQQMRIQAQESGADIKDANVTNVDFSQKPFVISTSEDKMYAHSVIIATGAQALWLNLDSEQRLRGRGVSACATCDGLFFRNKVVAVVGGGDTALEEALTLSKITEKVYVIHRRDSFRASNVMQERLLGKENIEVLWNTEVKEVQGEQKVEGLLLWNNKEEKERSLPVSGVFIAIGHKPDTGIVKDHIILNSKGYIYTSAVVALEKVQGVANLSDSFNFHYQTMTSVEGVFAGGDCVDYTYRQASTAVGMGVAASLDAERWLSEQDL